jgi:hypothetical protein
MNILKVIVGLLLPMVLAAQRPLSGFLNTGSTTLSGHYSIVFTLHDHDEAHRLKLSIAPFSGDHGAGRNAEAESCRRGQDTEAESAVRRVFRA